VTRLEYRKIVKFKFIFKLRFVFLCKAGVC